MWPIYRTIYSKEKVIGDRSKNGKLRECELVKREGMGIRSEDGRGKYKGLNLTMSCRWEGINVYVCKYKYK